MSASVTAAASARAMKRPRTLVGRVVADAVGLHPRLLEQPPVGRELRVARGELGVVFGDPALGVLGVEGLVQRDAEAAQHRTTLQLAALELRARGEQLVGVEVDRARVDLDVPGVGEPGSDQRPHRVQPLQHHGEAVGEVLVERVELAALGGGAVQLLDERRRAHHAVTARG